MFSSWTPQFWQFWIGLVLVLIVLIGRERMYRGVMWLPRLAMRRMTSLSRSAS
jgi:branched-chain amino acid transport system permease protein